jgi:stringent starvation protein B
MGMTSNRQYLLRALNDWIVDNGMAPYILVDADHPGTNVPKEFIQDGKIVLNISPNAVKNLFINDGLLICEARFSGKSISLQCPVAAVTAIYAGENGHGMVFPDEDVKKEKSDSSSVPVHTKPNLTVVK